MKVSEAWLKQWVDYDFSGEKLKDQLTNAGLEVDARIMVAGEFTNIIVAKVVSLHPHPNAQKLTICKVDTGKEILQIICGASNVCNNLKVALALPGAVLPDNFKIKETKLRGELSQGMLCSYSELKIDRDSDGIIELDDDAPVGMDLRQYLQLDDHVLEIELTPNRADCLGMVGIAREVAALNNLVLKEVDLKISKIDIDDTLNVSLDSPQLCPQYAKRIIKNINPDIKTPLWMREALLRAGIRPKFVIVDITNYVMLELGQPMHAFDLEKIEGDIYVRSAKPNEKMVLLDDTKVTLDNSELLITDDKKPLALAGIMGAKDSAVNESTRDILLESALFNPKAISGVARRFGLQSDSAQRFERGVDKKLQVLALQRATELVLDIAGGKAGPIVLVNSLEHLPQDISINFNPSKVKTLTGVDLPFALMKDILVRLGFVVVEKNDEATSQNSEATWLVRVPSHRMDIKIDVDLVEEIIRVNGYENLPSLKIPANLKTGTIDFNETIAKKIGNFLSNRGYSEVISYSFIDPKLQSILFPDTKALSLLNPISQELSQMRLSIIPGLIAAMIYSFYRQCHSFRLFETGTVFMPDDNGFVEQHKISGLISGLQNELNWIDQKRKFDFYDLKGDVEALLKSMKVQEFKFEPIDDVLLHPGKSAKIVVQNEIKGYLGAIHPKILSELDFDNDVFVFEIDSSLFANTSKVQYKQISRYPKIRRDLSFLVAKDVNAAQIKAQVQQVIPQSILKGFEVFDVYSGESIAQDKKSLAIALTLQDDHRTLIDSEVNEMIKAVVIKLEDNFSIILRDQ